MQKHPIRFKILMALINEGYATSKSLFTLDDNISLVNKCICQMTKENYICNQKRKYSTEDDVCIFQHKKITQKGVQWLVDNYSDEEEWLKYLPNPIPKFTICHKTKGERIHRMLKSISASIMFSNIGIPTYSNIRNVNKTELSELVSRAKEQYRIASGVKTEDQYKSSNGNITVYYHSKDIKTELSYTEEEKRQHLFINNHGLLIVRSNSYIIYVSKPKGIEFHKLIIERIKASIGKYIWTHSLTDETPFDRLSKAIVFCKNEKEFTDMIKRDYAETEQKKDAKRQSGLKDIYLVPIARESVNSLSDILYYNVDYYNTMINEIINYDSRFTKTLYRYYRLNMGNKVIHMGTDMELTRFGEFYRGTKTEPNREYMVVCFEWQKKYYERLLPENTEYYIVPDDILP